MRVCEWHILMFPVGEEYFATPILTIPCLCGELNLSLEFRQPTQAESDISASH